MRKSLGTLLLSFVVGLVLQGCASTSPRCVDDAEPLRFKVARDRDTGEARRVVVRSPSEEISFTTDRGFSWEKESAAKAPPEDGLSFPEWDQDPHVDDFLVTRERDHEGHATGTFLLWKRDGSSWKLEAKLKSED